MFYSVKEFSNPNQRFEFSPQSRSHQKQAEECALIEIEENGVYHMNFPLTFTLYNEDGSFVAEYEVDAEMKPVFTTTLKGCHEPGS